MNTLLWPSTHCILAAAGWLKTAPWSSRSPRPTTMLRRWSPRSSTSARRASEPRYSLRQLETRIKRVSTRTRTFGDYLYEIEKSNRCYIQNSGNKKVSTCCAEEEDFFDVKTKISVNLCLFWKLFEIVNKNQAQQSSWLTHLQRFSTAETFVWSAQLRLFVLTGKKLELKLAVSSDVSRHYFDNEQRPKIVCWNH